VSSRNVNGDFVYVAPVPFFAGLEGLDDGVAGGVEVFCGVLVFGGVAAAYVAAGAAPAEVDPGVAHRNALGADVFGFGFDGLDLVEVGTFFGHDVS